MDASVTLKVTPREFDLIRTAIATRQKQQFARANDKTGAHDPASKRASREEAASLGLILERLHA